MARSTVQGFLNGIGPNEHVSDQRAGWRVVLRQNTESGPCQRLEAGADTPGLAGGKTKSLTTFGHITRIWVILRTVRLRLQNFSNGWQPWIEVEGAFAGERE